MRTSWKSLILILAVLAALLFSAVRSGARKTSRSGDREMPVWGQAFLERTDNEADVRTQVHQLTVFLDSIQEKGPAKKK